MSPTRFDYLAPESVDEACGLLKEMGEGAVLMAGGTDLLIKIRRGLLAPAAVIDLRKIKGLDEISLNPGEGLTIGATALLAEVAHHPGIREAYPAVAYAARETANVQIRNMGTVAGNLCNAAPSADNAPVLLAMAAEVRAVSAEGERKIPLDAFFKGPGVTALKPGELVTSIFVPQPPDGSGSSYQHVSPRGSVDIASVGVGVMLTMKGALCEDAKIALGAVAPTPMRAIKAEDVLRGKELSPELIEEAGGQASGECSPISDMRTSAEYRRKMVGVLTVRAINASMQGASRT